MILEYQLVFHSPGLSWEHLAYINRPQKASSRNTHVPQGQVALPPWSRQLMLV